VKHSFPKIIHQTVANKANLSCQQRQVISSWKQLNPHYHHRLWDDQEMRDFMLQHYPEMVPVPYDEFLYAAERTDLWRVLVLHTVSIRD
jgi:mannosyltransferase OCH1-like enzyme